MGFISECFKDEKNNYIENHVISLTEEEKDEIYNLIQKIDIHNTILDSKELIDFKMYSKFLPNRIIYILEYFKAFSNENGVLLFKNLPQDNNLPSTPHDGNPSNDKNSFVSETILYLFMSVLGDIIGYEDEKNGQLVHDICPIKGKEKNIENSGSDVFFSYHIEDAVHPFKPDYLSLYCLRSDHDNQAFTETASIDKAVSLLTDSTIDTLKKPLFLLKPPASFNSDNLAKKVSVLTENNDGYRMLIHESLMEGITEDAKLALDELKSILPSVSNSIQLQPGYLVIIDNNKSAHARSSFKPRYDGNDRWLQRMFSINDIKQTSNSRHVNTNVCIPLKTLLQ